MPVDPSRFNFKAVLFDFDGTLADSFPAIAASVNHVRSIHGLPPLSVDEVRVFVGRGPAHLLGCTVPAGRTEANVAAYRAHHPSVLRTGTTLLPGALETLTALHGRGRKLGVCSNKLVGFTRELLSFLKLDHFLDAVLGPEDVPRPKPAPDMLLAALDRLGVAAAHTLYVGDMVVDIETARAAGVTVWIVPTGADAREKLERGRPDRLLHDLHEVSRLLVPPDLDAAYKHASRNRGELTASELSGCFHCLAVFPSVQIEDWLSEGVGTAVCPECGIDSVIGSASGYPISREFLEQMQKRWFQ